MADFFKEDFVRQTRKRLTVVQPKPLPIDPQWRCQRSGDCCTQPAEVVMTQEEASVLVLHAPPEIKMEFRPAGENFVAMKAGPCPLFVFKTCLVYEHRPYNCRRFGCMRPDPKTEPFEKDGGNLLKRVNTSKAARKLAIWMQKRAQAWARTHGWLVED